MKISGSEQGGVNSFFPYLPLSTTKNAGQTTTVKHKKTLKGGKKNVDWLGTQHLNVVVNGFFVSCIYPRLDTGEVCNLEMPLRADQKKKKRERK